MSFWGSNSTISPALGHFVTLFLGLSQHYRDILKGLGAFLWSDSWGHLGGHMKSWETIKEV